MGLPSLRNHEIRALRAHMGPGRAQIGLPRAWAQALRAWAQALREAPLSSLGGPYGPPQPEEP